jgi:hypothetical protein
LLVELTTHVVGPADDADGVEAAGAAGLIPVHPAVGCAVSGFDRWGEGGGDVGGGDLFDGGGDCEIREEGGEEGHDEEVDGRHRDFRGAYGKASVSLYVARWRFVNRRSS